MKSKLDWIIDKDKICDNLEKLRTLTSDFYNDIGTLILYLNESNHTKKQHDKQNTIITDMVDKSMEIDDIFNEIHHSFAVYNFNKQKEKLKNKKYFKSLKCAPL